MGPARENVADVALGLESSWRWLTQGRWSWVWTCSDWAGGRRLGEDRSGRQVAQAVGQERAGVGDVIGPGEPALFHVGVEG
ncbi:hypothetical protein CKJ70_26355 [Mycobacterium avium]|uniref:Uncharacterized protein n=1 Tax=Mycobacterium avium subsp. hominissuis TaxID=439334 RepID=A0AAI8SSR7_MYCAV|nr:hypothetical protein CKJ70_26355 [Mycobacterium avium]BBN50930.1 hypothetical protein JPH1_54050 [Mycobacterium avium subsp. hominissuis]